MPASEAQIKANQANAARSTGPKTDEGKARSRRNALQHGLTGQGMVMPEDDAADVDRLTRELRDDMKPPGRAGEMLIRQMAICTIRMQRSFDQETAALSRRVRQTMDEFVPPEGVDEETAKKRRIEAGNIALFDPSKEASLARRYEAAARRGFFQAFQELRLLNKPSAISAAAEIAAQNKASLKQLASFFPLSSKTVATVPTPPPAPSKPVTKPTKATLSDWDPFAAGHVDVPFAIGKPR
jgi:hypothetical protein